MKGVFVEPLQEAGRWQSEEGRFSVRPRHQAPAAQVPLQQDGDASPSASLVPGPSFICVQIILFVVLFASHTFLDTITSAVLES